MSINHLSLVRPGASAWEVLQLEYTLNGDYDRGLVSAVSQAVDKEDDFDTVRGFQKPRTIKCVKLSADQQRLLADWHAISVMGGGRTIIDTDFTEDGDLIELSAVTFQSSEFLKLVDMKGQKIVFHHWKEGQKASKRLRNSWRWADVIVCCHSATLPSEYQHKAAVYSGGVVELQGSVVWSRK